MRQYCKIHYCIVALTILFSTFCFVSTYARSEGLTDNKDDTNVVVNLIKLAYEIKFRNMDSGRLLFIRALELSKKLKYDRGIIECYIRLGTSYSYTGNFDSSRIFYFLALAANNNQGNDDKLEQIYQGIGTSYALQDNFEEAVTYYLKSLKIAEGYIENKNWSDTVVNEHILDIIECYCNLAPLFNDLKQYDKEIYYLEKGEKLARAKKAYRGLSGILINKANYDLLIKNDLTAAEITALEALSISTTNQIIDNQQFATIILGDIYLKKNDTTKAIQYYNTALSIGNGQLLEGKMRALLSLGDLYSGKGQYSIAEKMLFEARDLSTESKIAQSLADAYHGLANLYKAEGQYKKAFVEYDSFVLINDSLSKNERESKVNFLEIKYRTAQKDKTIAENNLLIAWQNQKIIRKNIWITGISLFVFMLALFFFIFYVNRQRIQAEKIKTIREEEKVKMLLSVMKGEEKERARLAGELHDGIGGMLSTVKMYFSNLQKKESMLHVSIDYHDAMGLLDETITEVRKTAHNLMPELLFNYGLPEALKMYCDTVQKANKIKINFQYYGFIGRLNSNFELFVYRTIQELLQNIIKHSQATEALVQISQHDTILSITVEDNGTGIKENHEEYDGMGLQVIQSRIKDLNGQFTINSNKEKGTSVYIEIDIKNHEKYEV